MVNPTGDCTAPGNGARLGGPLQAEGDVWVPDCDNVLTREYWRVFVRETGTVYIVPPSEETPPEALPCSTLPLAGHPLCVPGSPEAFAFLASMDIAEALAFAHDAHAAFEFSFTGRYAGSGQIVPPPFLEDIVAACDLSTAEDSPDLGPLCGRERDRYESGDAELSVTYEGQAGADLTYLLNRLYGIDAVRYTATIDAELCSLPSDTSTCSLAGPRYFYNPVTATCEPFDFGACEGTGDFATEQECGDGCRRRARGCSCSPEPCTIADCSHCPPDIPVNEPCSVVDLGLFCEYWGGDSECLLDPSGNAMWRFYSSL